MDKENKDYHISLFKPTTDRARFNRDLVIWLASIWFIAIFGFQILLRVVQKPTPEPAFINFENVWDNIRNETASMDEIKQFGRASLSVLGKVSIEPEERSVLSNALSWSVLNLFHDTIQPVVINKIKDFEALKAKINDISDESYVNAKFKLSKKLSPILGLEELDPRTRILPLELTSTSILALSENAISSLPSIMKKYLVHNQSFLTDLVFLGFPFHYFYTAVFLLILFVGLCWLYCIRTDRRDKILDIED
ncbi:DUF4212 domain-containing protein [Bacteroidota bacterium]